MSVFKEVMESLFGKKNSFNNVTVNGSIVGGKINKEDYGPVVNHPVQFQDFSSVSIVGPFKTVIQQGEKLAIQLEINEKLIPFFKVETVNGLLKIKVDKDVLNNPVLKLSIIAPHLDMIHYNGVGQIDIKDFKQEKIKIKKSGPGNCTLNGDFETIHLDILSIGNFSAKLRANEAVINKDGTGDCLIEGEIENPVFILDGTGDFDYVGLHSKVVKINQSAVGSSSFQGSCDTLELISSGVGSVNARGMKAANITLNTSGVGSINVTAINSIVGSSTGVGGVHVYGNPTNARVTKKCIGELVYH